MQVASALSNASPICICRPAERKVETAESRLRIADTFRNEMHVFALCLSRRQQTISRNRMPNIPEVTASGVSARIDRIRKVGILKASELNTSFPNLTNSRQPRSRPHQCSSALGACTCVEAVLPPASLWTVYSDTSEFTPQITAS